MSTQTIPTENGELYVRDNVIIGRKVIKGKVTTWYKDMTNIIHNENGPAIIDEENHQTIYMQDGKWHREDGPAQIITYPDGSKRRETWARDDKFHRDEQNGQTDPADIEWYPNGNKKMVAYYQNDKMHRFGAPAVYKWYENCILKHEWYYQNGKLHNEQGLAAIREWHPNGQIRLFSHYVDGKLHRVGGPAIVYYNSDGDFIDAEYYINGIKCKSTAPEHSTKDHAIAGRLDAIESALQKIIAELRDYPRERFDLRERRNFAATDAE